MNAYYIYYPRDFNNEYTVLVAEKGGPMEDRPPDSPGAVTTNHGGEHMKTREYRILWGHSGRRGRQWSTAREASRYASVEWGTVEATSVDEAMTTAEREGLDFEDFWHDGDGNIHVI